MSNREEVKKQYFIHSWKDVGAKFLCEKVKSEYLNEEVLVHGEYDIASKTWVPITDAGQPYEAVNWREKFDVDNWRRVSTFELNKNISQKEADKIIEKLKNFKD